MTDTVKVLSDDALSNLEKQKGSALININGATRYVLLTETTRDALCATVRALREQLQEEQNRNQTQAESIMALEAENTALREQLAHVTASLEELRALRDRWLALLNPMNSEETVEGAIRNLQQAHVTERDNAVELQSQLAQVTQENDELRKCDACERKAIERACRLHGGRP